MPLQVIGLPGWVPSLDVTQLGCYNNPQLYDIDAFTPKDAEPAYPPYEVVKICGACELRVQCLAWAIANEEEGGYWGGTTRYQREQMHRTRNRQTCPDCGNQLLTTLDDEPVQICITCAASWSVRRAG